MNKLIGIGILLNGLLATPGGAGQTLNVSDYGAKGDGVTKDTAAIQQALDACGQHGGGTVTVPEGVFLTGSLVLHANTTLQMASRAALGQQRGQHHHHRRRDLWSAPAAGQAAHAAGSGAD